MAINTQKLLPASKTGGAIVKGASTKAIAGRNKTLGVIKVKIVDISKILKGSVAVDKKLLDDKKRQESEERKEEQEQQLENQVKKDTNNKIPMPKKLTSFFDAIKNFIKNIILGYLAVRLLDQLPKLIPIVHVWRSWRLYH